MSALLNFLQMLSVAFPQKYKDQKVLWESILILQVIYLLIEFIIMWIWLSFFNSYK